MIDLTRAITEEKEYAPFLDALKTQCAPEYSGARRPVVVTGLCEGAIDVFLASCISEIGAGGKPALICAPDEKTASGLAYSLTSFGLRTAVYPERDPVLYNIISSHELEHERIAVLTDILPERLDVVIATPTAALSYTIPADILEAATKKFAVGDCVEMDELADFLIRSGYVRSDLVDGKGKFSIRGGIIDIYPPQLQLPVRMELFGDEIDQIGYFDLMTQRKTEKIQEFTVTCAREILISDEKRKGLAMLIGSAAAKAKSVEAKTSLMHEYETLENGIDIAFADKYISYIYPQHTILLDYLSGNSLAFAIETNAIQERLQSEQAHMLQTTGDLIKEGLLLPKYAEFSADITKIYAFFESHSALLLNNFVTQYPGRLAGMFSFSVRPTPASASDFEILKEFIKEAKLLVLR